MKLFFRKKQISQKIFFFVFCVFFQKNNFWQKPDDGGDDNDDTPEQDTSRIVRLIFYFVLYGVVLEISLLIARYQRHHDTHDEYHGFLMFIVCVGGLGFDLWYILANLDNLFTGFWARMKVGFIIGVTLFFFIQICKPKN